MDWNSSLNVGVEFMDDDHEHAAQLINSIKLATPDELKDLVSQFLKHCEEHFAREEELMQKVGFFAYECHKGEHDRVLAELRQLIDDLSVDPGKVSGPQLHDHLENWLLNHRNTMDFVTANFAMQQGYAEAG